MLCPSNCYLRPPALALFVMAMALATLPLHVTSQQTIKVTDGFLHENRVYNQDTILDLKGLDNTRKVSSSATVRNGQIQSILYISGGGGTPSDTFATSLYMTLTKMHIAAPTADCYYYIEYLPPNAYILLKETTSYKTDRRRSISIQTGWEYNTTLVILDSVLEDNGNGPAAFLTFAPTDGRVDSFVDNCVMHVKNLKVINHNGLINLISKLQQQSALVFEDIQGDRVRGPAFYISPITIKDHSAIIVIRLKFTHSQNDQMKTVLYADSLDVDATSAFSLIDVDMSNGFRASTMAAFSNKVIITGGGEIVFSRLLMQKSGLTSKQPQNNANFWVSARVTANNDLSVSQLQSQNFNVRSQNVYKWDGTGEDSTTCVPVGASIPGRATYSLVDGKCTPTCNDGYIPPACTAPAKSQCRVDNCDLCYRVTKTKCMLCAPHTTIENNDQRCRCPTENLGQCQICPTDSTCTLCIEGYNLTNGGAPCIPCSINIQKCIHCNEPNVCEQCAPRYNVSADKKECYSCPIDNCLHCDGHETCDQCIPHYNASAAGETKNRCFLCDLPKCTLCKDESTCDKCVDGYSVPEGGTECTPCPIKHCERCNLEGLCAQCPDNHTPDGGKHCHPCTMPGCLKCDGDEQCVQCDDKYTLIGKKCMSCDIPHCKSCLADGVCDQCEPKHTLHNDGTTSECIPCDIDGCATCDSDSHCSTCANGNPPVDDGKECVSCEVSNCAYCNATDSCAECNDRHSIAADDAGKMTCISCNIDHCLFCGAADTCHQCEPSFNISRDGAKCNSCFVADCQRCEEDGVCALCDTTLSVSLNGGECTPCDIGNCTYCSTSGECSLCKCGLVPTSDGKECVSCEAANCKHCDLSSDGSTCAECAEGYSLSDGSCRKGGLPSWGIFLIVVAASIILVSLFWLGVFLYLRRRSKLLEMERDAEERRRNRQTKGSGTRHHMEIGILDLGDIENAASGVRDNQNKYNVRL